MNSRDGELLSMLAACHAGSGNTERAIQLLKRALEGSSTNGTVFFRAASIYCDDLSQPEEALQYLKLAVKSGFPINQIALSDGRSASPCEITNAWTNNAIRVGAVQPRVGPFASALGTLARNAPIPSPTA